MRNVGRRLVFITLICLAATGSLFAADVASEIRAIMNAQVAAWNRGDIDGFMDGYVRSDQLEFVSGGKITRGWQTVRDRYHKKYRSREEMGLLTFSDIKVSSLNANTAVVQGRWSLRRKADQPHGSFVLVFRHQPEGWRIVHDETS